MEKELIKLVKEMRRLQKKYFANKRQGRYDLLNSCKEAEKLVDEQIIKIESTQTKLPL